MSAFDERKRLRDMTASHRRGLEAEKERERDIPKSGAWFHVPRRKD